MRSSATIEKSAKIWVRYGICAPIIFSTVAFIALFTESVDTNHVLVVGVVVALVTCFVWWFWALSVIIDLTQMNKIAKNALTDIKDLVIMTNVELREQRNLYDLLKDEVDKKSDKKVKKVK